MIIIFTNIRYSYILWDVSMKYNIADLCVSWTVLARLFDSFNDSYIRFYLFANPTEWDSDSTFI